MIKNLFNYIYKNSISFKFRKDFKNKTFFLNFIFKIYRCLLFVNVKNPFLQKWITKHYLDFVEVEIFSFCNRQCWFCPNSFIDRHSKNILMPETTYLKLINELQSINYKGLITYSRYNEPTSDKIFLTRLRQAREKLPDAFLITHSNGDYINKEYIDELADAGLNLIRLQCYLNENEKFDVETVIKPKMAKYIKKIDLPYKEICACDYYAIQFEHPSLSIICEAINFTASGSNRGGTLDKMPKKQRTAQCVSPINRLYIDYDGSVMPCCQVRHDVKEHSHLIMGNIEKNTIFEIFTNNLYARLRKNLCFDTNKISPCSTCNATETFNIFDSCNTQYVENYKKEFMKNYAKSICNCSNV